MKLHPRVEIYQRARNDIDAAVSEALRKNPDLTYLELASILNEIQRSWIGYGIRDERHQYEPDRPGGLE